MMKKFMTSKLVEVELMTRREYVESRGWELPENEEHLENEAVYKVIYQSGYVSMCPVEEFEKSALEIEGDKIPKWLVESYVTHWDYNTVFVGPDDKPGTQVYATLMNGAVLGEFTTCVDPVNYDMNIGFEICKARIMEKIWFMLGMQLQTAKSGS